MRIESYRGVFDIERRIYRVERLRLNPGGVPLRGVVYFAALAIAMLLAGRLPAIGAAVGVLPWWLGDVALPVGAASVLGAVRIDGRTAHQAGLGLARYACTPSRLLGVRPAPAPARAWRPSALVVVRCDRR